MNKKIKAVCFTGRRQIGEQVINMMQTLEKEVINRDALCGVPYKYLNLFQHLPLIHLRRNHGRVQCSALIHAHGH